MFIVQPAYSFSSTRGSLWGSMNRNTLVPTQSQPSLVTASKGSVDFNLSQLNRQLVCKLFNLKFAYFYVLVIYHTSHQRTNVARGRFLGGSGRRVEAHTRPARPKIPSTLSVFYFLGRLRRQAINLPPKGGKILGEWPPEAVGTLQCRGTPGRTAQRYDGLLNATQQLERKD